ncbi:Hypothetical predicted protein, partial [Mytilus galloprovincialis]
MRSMVHGVIQLIQTMRSMVHGVIQTDPDNEESMVHGVIQLIQTMRSMVHGVIQLIQTMRSKDHWKHGWQKFEDSCYSIQYTEKTWDEAKSYVSIVYKIKYRYDHLSMHSFLGLIRNICVNEKINSVSTNTNGRLTDENKSFPLTKLLSVGSPLMAERMSNVHPADEYRIKRTPNGSIRSSSVLSVICPTSNGCIKDTLRIQNGNETDEYRTKRTHNGRSTYILSNGHQRIKRIRSSYPVFCQVNLNAYLAEITTAGEKDFLMNLLPKTTVKG